MTQAEEIAEFEKLINENRYNFVKLAYIIFPFGEKGHALEFMEPYDWQIEEWAKLSRHLMNPLTRHEAYRLCISSGNGAAKTAFGAMTYLILMYTQRLRGRITANTQPQLNSIVWPEYDVWFRHARYNELFFEKFGTSIKAKDPKLGETWRLDAVTWNEATPASISGLHNKGGAIIYIFEEAAGIPSIIWKYASGAMTDTDTIKIWLAFANSDDPESQFEQNMSSPLWHSKRIDTRTMKHVDPKQIEAWLIECGGNEDHDDFRVRVRGMPRKTAKDSIISQESVDAALLLSKDFQMATVSFLPCILTCDPAWTGGDETVIGLKQGNYFKILDKYKLDKMQGETHMLTYQKLCQYERQYAADAVFIDQAEGTAIYTLAQHNYKSSWELISFSSSPNDTPEPQKSEYANMRAQMYYEAAKWLAKGGILDVADPEWVEMFKKQLCWAKGARHKVTMKKLVESKIEIKNRVGQSPDLADAFVLCFSRPVMERLPENDVTPGNEDRFKIGEGAYQMPDHDVSYEDVDFRDIYD